MSRRSARPSSRSATSSSTSRSAAGSSAAGAGDGEGGGRRELLHPPGRDPRARGRVRLRQDHHGALHPPARAPDERPGDLRGPGPGDARATPSCGRCAGAMQVIFQDPYSSLNPRMTVGQIIAEPLGVHGIVPERARARGARARSCSARPGSCPPWRGAIRTSSRAGSASGSASRGRWPWSRRSSSATSRSPRSTSRSRRRSSTCSRSSRPSSASPTSSSPTTSRWCGTSPTGWP